MGWLPSPILALLGYLLGIIVWPFSGKRRKVAKTNLALCFPKRNWLWHQYTLFIHGMFLGRFFLDYALLIVSSKNRIKRLVKVTNKHNLPTTDTKVILAVPHFLGLEAGFARLLVEYDVWATYAPQHTNFTNQITKSARLSCADKDEQKVLVSVTEKNSSKLVLEFINAKRPMYNLSDLDFGPYQKSVFVPFLAVENAATSISLSRLAKLTDAVVVPCVTRALFWGGYEVTIGKAWDEFPSNDVNNDMLRFNTYIGQEVEKSPAQYYWVHRRFKTQPEGINLYG